MAKITVIDSGENIQVPFLRGILTHSLQDAGLPFDDAYELASVVRLELCKDLGESGGVEISTEELRDRVSTLLAQKYPRAMLQRYTAAPIPPRPILIGDQGGQTAPFSRATLRRSLQTTGLSVEVAARVTAEVYTKLIGSGRTELSANELGRMTYECLEQELDQAAARRYLTWAAFRRSGRPLLLLIGGTAGSGKSTLATELAHQVDIVRTQSTDMLREVMRMLLPERLVPVLYASSYNAWEIQAHAEGEEAEHEARVASGYRQQADLLAVACEAVIQRAFTERVSLILEGVHVHPSLLERIPRDSDAVVVPLMLAVLKPSELHKRFKGRGSELPSRRAESYLKYFDSIWALQSFLLSEADRWHVPIITNDDMEKVIQLVMGQVIDALPQDDAWTVEQIFDSHE